jgi:hypothetical protein
MLFYLHQMSQPNVTFLERLIKLTAKLSNLLFELDSVMNVFKNDVPILIFGIKHLIEYQGLTDFDVARVLSAINAGEDFMKNSGLNVFSGDMLIIIGAIKLRMEYQILSDCDLVRVITAINSCEDFMKGLRL